MKRNKKLKSRILLVITLLSSNVSCVSFNRYESDRQRDSDEYVYKIPQQDREAYEHERQRNRNEYEKNRQQDRVASEQDRQRNRNEYEQNRQQDRHVYEDDNEDTDIDVSVEEDMFPLSREFMRNGHGRPLDQSSFIVTFSTILPFSLVADSVTSISKVTSGKHTHKRRMRRHAASWNNPNSMIAISSKADN